MITKFVEACHEHNGQQTGNWGKFMVGRFTYDDVLVKSQIDQRSLIFGRGWAIEQHLWVMDIQTGEGAIFRHGGHAKADLDKHKIWVCPLFEPFLTWLYKQPLMTLDGWEALPTLVTFKLDEAEFQMSGYRRSGGETG